MTRSRPFFNYALIIGSLWIMSACVDKFNPEIDGSDDQPYVIDALLTNELKQHQVFISKAISINDQGSFESVTNATVQILDSHDQIQNFSHASNGAYVSNSEFEGEIGTAYKIIIQIDQEIFESDFETLPEPDQITGVNAKFSTKTIQDEVGNVVVEPRVSFSVDLSFPENENSFYRFDWESTYEAFTDNQGSAVCWEERGEEPPNDLELNKRCYIQDNPNAFLELFSTEGLIGGSVESIEIFDVHPNKRFQTRYSPEITMYKITENAFRFWEAVENQISNSGSLFDTPPSPILGNIQNNSQKGNRVVGVFEVASVTRRREFFTRNVVEQDLSNYSNDCILPTGPFGSPAPPRPLSCCECTLLQNSTDIKPSYW